MNINLYENLLAALLGITGASIHLQNTVQTYQSAKIFEGFITAALYGAAGMFGKQLYTWTKLAIRFFRKKYFKS